MNSIIINPIRGLAVIRDLAEVDEVLGALRDLLPEGGAVVGGQAVAEDLDAGAVVDAGDALH